MKTIALILCAVGLAGCNSLSTGQQLTIAAAAVQTGCALADAATGAAMTIQAAKLPPDADPATSRTYRTWAAGNKISGEQCAQLAQAVGAIAVSVSK